MDDSFELKLKVAKIEEKVDAISDNLPILTQNLQELTKIQHDLVRQLEYHHNTFERVFKKLESLESTEKTKLLMEKTLKDVEERTGKVDERTKYFPLYEKMINGIWALIGVAIVGGMIWGYGQVYTHWGTDNKTTTQHEGK